MREIAAEEITYRPGSSAVGLAASVFAELAEGGYHICLAGEDPSLYHAYYVAVYKTADFTPDEFTVVTEDRTNAALDMQRFLPFYLEGPETYSLSSGEDCVIIYHNGIGQSVYSVWYWDGVECNLTITDVGSGQFTVPHEVLQQFKDSGSDFGMTVAVQMPSDLYLFPGIYIELTD